MNDKLTVSSIIQNTVLVNINQHRHLLVAYSGGIDSTVLLHALVVLKQQTLLDLQLNAIYIHHGISQHADSWAAHCQSQCQLWNVPCAVKKVNITLESGNIEAQAREARYAEITKQMRDQTVLCTAQHLDDQSETFFLALKRGSGPTGLSAMPAESQFGNNLFLRPLLDISRQQIEQYAKENQLSWVEDESNQDTHYDRNFLRQTVLPQLNHRWPHFNQMVARSAALCGEQQQLLDELLNESFNQIVDESLSIAIMPLLKISPIKRNALLRMWFKQHQIIMPSRQQLDLIWQTVALAKEDSNPQFCLNSKQIRRYQNKLYLLPVYQNLQPVCLDWDLERPLILPDNLGQIKTLNCTDMSSSANCCRRPNIDEKVSIKFTAQGQFSIIGRHGSRQIKKLWQEFAIPPWQRSRIPLIYYNETLIAAVGIFVTIQGKGNDIYFDIH